MPDIQHCQQCGKELSHLGECPPCELGTTACDCDDCYAGWVGLAIWLRSLKVGDAVQVALVTVSCSGIRPGVIKRITHEADNCDIMVIHQLDTGSEDYWWYSAETGIASRSDPSDYIGRIVPPSQVIVPEAVTKQIAKHHDVKG